MSVTLKTSTNSCFTLFGVYRHLNAKRVRPTISTVSSSTSGSSHRLAMTFSITMKKQTSATYNICGTTSISTTSNGLRKASTCLRSPSKRPFGSFFYSLKRHIVFKGSRKLSTPFETLSGIFTLKPL